MTPVVSVHAAPTQLRVWRCKPRRLLTAGLLSLIAACSSSRITEQPPVASRPDPLPIAGHYELSASTELVRDPTARLHYTVIVTNTSTTQIDVDYGGCWSFFQLFKTSDLTQLPVFDAGAVGASCTLSDTRVPIPVGASGTLSGYYPVAALTSWGVAPGHYFVAIRLAPNDTLRQIAAGQLDVQP